MDERLIPLPLGIPGVAAGYTTRDGGCSAPPFDGWNLAMHVGDAPEAVAANRDRLSSLTGVAGIQWLEQVHGTNVVAADFTSVRDAPVADAAYSSQYGLALAVLTADCLPVVLASSRGEVIGVAHVGWRGLIAGVIERLHERMRQVAAITHAAIGAGICARCYEVGDEVVARVRDRGLHHACSAPGEDVYSASGCVLRGDGSHLDLAGAAGIILERLGVGDVRRAPQCALGDPRLYSYRRDGTTGRFATLVWRERR